MQEVGANLTIFWVLFGCKVMQALGLGETVKSLRVAGGGQPTFYFFKRPVVDTMVDVLDELDIHSESTPSLAAYTAMAAAEAPLPPRANAPAFRNQFPCKLLVSMKIWQSRS